jgi:tripartite-type tricarboxylate transporter receptor subunit TctC
LAVPAPGAFAQSGRTVRIVVPYPPGGSADILARLLGDEVARTNGVGIVVENRPGAGTVIATESVSRAAPDGNTVLIVANSFVINPNVKKLNYDPLTSFAPICSLLRSPQVIVVNSASPYRTLNDLLDAARARPGELTLASVGPATTQQIAFEMLKRAANVNMTHVPFAGNAPAVNALLGDHVTSVLANYSEVFEQVNAGKLRALATASRERIALMPDVPTIAESGFKDFEVEVWFGLVAPAKTPPEKLAELGLWFTLAMHAPPVKAKLAMLGLYPIGLCGDAFAAFLRAKYDAYAKIIREAGISGE